MVTASKEEDLNAYERLGITIEATEAEIKTAYRQCSLKVHPDRHPNNPDAAQKFHELNQAYELLLDPIRKTDLDASLRVKFARKERFSKFDAKRKGMQNELEEAERAVKKAKMNKVRQEREQKEEADRIKEEGRRMRREREDEIRRKEEEQKSRDKKVAETFEIGPLDTTVRVKYPLSVHPTLTTPSSLATLLSSFGTIDVSTIVISMKPSKKAPQEAPKLATALVPFSKIGQAHAAVCASGMETRGLKDIKISWADGKQPKILDALKRTHQLDPVRRGSQVSNSPLNHPAIHNPPSGATASATLYTPSFSFDPTESPTNHPPPNAPGLDYESITLIRLRQAERERLEREIREQEAEAVG